MRIALYGNHLALALIACAEIAEVASKRPVWRNDVMFKAEQTEGFDVIVVLDSSLPGRVVLDAYTALEKPPATFAVPEVGTKRELLSSVAFRAYAEHLGIVLPTEEELLAELDAEAASTGSDTAADDGSSLPPAAVVASDDDAAEPLLPKVANLAAHVATITDADALLDLMQRDTRKTAAPIYEARFAELTTSSATPAA